MINVTCIVNKKENDNLLDNMKYTYTPSKSNYIKEEVAEQFGILSNTWIAYKMMLFLPNLVITTFTQGHNISKNI